MDGSGHVSGGVPEAVVVVGRSGQVGSWSGTPQGGARWSCGYYGVTPPPAGNDDDAPEVHYDDGPVDPVEGEPYVLACDDQAGRRVRSILVAYDPADPLGGIAAVERATEEARRRLDLPLPEPALNPPGEQLVGVPTWLWLEGAWAPRSATASVGAVAATVTARPVEVVWDLGDGTRLTCDAGTPYDPARPPDGQASGCTHVFTTSSGARPGGAYAVTATVGYAVGWSASTGAAGDLGDLSRSTTLPVRVVEAQAIIR